MRKLTLCTAREARKAGLSAEMARSLTNAIAYCVNKMHVSTPDRDVVRDAVRRVRFAAIRRRKPFALPREARKVVYRAALRAHANNRSLYAYVMGGK